MNDRQHRLLVVDDDSRLRDLLVRYLGEQGLDVKAVGDAAHMDKLRTREHFDLVVLDLMLPGEDGLSLARHLREHYDLGIIMVSGAGDTVIATMAALIAAGASLADAVRVANEAAGVVVGKLGTAVVHPSELA